MIVVLSFFTAVLFGCASAQKARLVPALPGEEAQKSQPEALQDGQKYTVEKGDYLWKIAFKIYGDPAKWPLIFEINRDRIKDPDIIHANQVLVIKKDFTDEEIKDAKQIARYTPAYKQKAAE